MTEVQDPAPQLAPSPAPAAPEAAPTGAKGLAKFFYAMSVLSALLGGAFGSLEYLLATSAPQQGAAAAMACASAIVPYVIARSLDGLDR